MKLGFYILNDFFWRQNHNPLSERIEGRNQLIIPFTLNGKKDPI